MTPRALIVGCGYLGRVAARLLIEHGIPVIGTTRSPDKARALQALGIEPCLLDVQPGSIPDRLPPASHVLYCVGYDRRSGTPPRAVYVDAVAATLERLTLPVTRLVFASSTGVYGQAEGAVVDESTPPAPRTETGALCLEAETLVAQVSAARGFPAVVLRFAGLYGPGRLIQRARIENGEPIAGDPEHWLNLIHIHDAARAAVAALIEGAPHGLYIASDGHPVPRRLFYETLARLLGAPDPGFSPTPSTRDATSKRVDSRRLWHDLKIDPQYPNCQVGLVASLAQEAGGSG
jgi:nucleoside-diphosphate-sugar epimerase